MWERPINLAPKADFNHGFIGLFHWGMGFAPTEQDPIPLFFRPGEDAIVMDRRLGENLRGPTPALLRDS